jgi:hypothetical protein
MRNLDLTPCGDQPSASTAFSILSMRRFEPAKRTTTRPTISTGPAMMPTIGTAGPGPQHPIEGGLEGANRVAGERWLDGGGDFGSSGQELAHGPLLAPPLCGEGGGRAAEGRNTPVAPQAVAPRANPDDGNAVIRAPGGAVLPTPFEGARLLKGRRNGTFSPEAAFAIPTELRRSLTSAVVLQRHIFSGDRNGCRDAISA